MAKAYSVSKILAIKHRLMDWGEDWVAAFGRPAVCGVWFVWGNSTNGKTRFLLRMAKVLSMFFRVFYNSREEGNGHTMQEALKAEGIDGSNHNLLIGNETFAEMHERLKKRRAPQVVFMDSIQYFDIRFKSFKEMVEQNPNTLFIVNSQAEGKHPVGNVAKAIRYDAALKIFVEGHLAISQGRYNPGGQYVIWHEGAGKYHGSKEQSTTQTHTSESNNNH